MAGAAAHRWLPHGRCHFFVVWSCGYAQDAVRRVRALVAAGERSHRGQSCAHCLLPLVLASVWPQT
jgi:hypothetical protein